MAPLPCERFGYVRCSANLLHQKMIGDFSIFVKKSTQFTIVSDKGKPFTMECTSEFPRMCSRYSFHLKDNKTIPVITVFRWEQGCEEPSHALASPFHLSSPLRYRYFKTVTPLALSCRPPPPRRLPSLLPDRRLPWSHALGMALHQ